MKLIPLITLLLLFCGQVSAQAQYSLQPRMQGIQVPRSLLGTWGTAEQCRAHNTGKIDNPRLYPYLISSEWIRQGNVYCYLLWHEHEHDADSLQATALAQCGEDNLREYSLVLSLRQQQLRIRWSDDFTTRALEAC
jgi:hypothetical protein